MPKKPKHPKDMTTEEAMRHLFPKEVVAHAKKEAGKAKKQVRSTKKDSK